MLTQTLIGGHEPNQFLMCLPHLKSREDDNKVNENYQFNMDSTYFKDLKICFSRDRDYTSTTKL